ncbi:DEKNAAC102563 [Brettanomyces naardenensis]|uniref:DEKNAAC102563 n=1 Tax=Brettanomyces naardenensis TaxID=13370 RepID=A0A448YL53_BRENA|nr:DEKNAAC102563 [Brettanomyces naardenensis]
MSSENPLTSDHLSKTIKLRLQANEVEVQDMSGGCGQAFAVIIVSDIFRGKNKLTRHRMVNNALSDEISHIHAFTQKVFTTDEWEEQKRLFGSS